MSDMIESTLVSLLLSPQTTASFVLMKRKQCSTYRFTARFVQKLTLLKCDTVHQLQYTVTSCNHQMSQNCQSEVTRLCVNRDIKHPTMFSSTFKIS